MERENKYSKGGGNSWREIYDLIFVSFFKLVQVQAATAIKRKISKVVLTLSSFIIMLIGAIYFINGIAIGINEFFGIGDWLGFFLVGLALLITGKIVKGKSQGYN